MSRITDINSIGINRIFYRLSHFFIVLFAIVTESLTPSASNVEKTFFNSAQWKMNLFFHFSPFFLSTPILTWPARSYPWLQKKEWDFKTITGLDKLLSTSTTTTTRKRPQQLAHRNNNNNNNINNTEDHCLNQVMKEIAAVKTTNNNNNNNNGRPLLTPRIFCT